MRVSWERWVIPTFAYYSAFFIIPYVIFIRNSFFAYKGPAQLGSDLTVANFQKLLTDSFYLKALFNSITTSSITMMVTLVLAVPTAYFVARNKSRWVSTIYTIMYVSALTSTVIRGMGMLSLLSPGGPFNRLIVATGLVSEPLRLTNNLTGAIIALIHFAVPYAIMLLVPVIRSVEPALEEASAGLGATRWTTMSRVLVPLILPGLIASGLMIFAMTLGAYTTPAIVGGARISLYPMLIYQQINATLNYALGSALSLVLMVLALAVVLLTNIASRGRLHRT